MGDRRSQGNIRELHNWDERQGAYERGTYAGISQKPGDWNRRPGRLRPKKCHMSWAWKKNQNNQGNSRNLTTY